MSFQGWNPGPAIGDFAKTIEQGYRDRAALDMERQKMAAYISNQQYDNLQKAIQVENTSGPFGGREGPVSALYPPKDPQQVAEDAAALARKNVTPPNVYNSRTGQMTTFDTNDDQSSNNSPSPDRSPAGNPSQPLPGLGGAGYTPPAPEFSQTYQQNFLPDGQWGYRKDGSFLARNGTPLTAEDVSRALSMKGQINPDTGGVLLPNHAWDNIQKTNNLAYEAQLMANRFASRPLPEKTIVDNGPKGKGGKTPANPMVKALQGQIDAQNKWLAKPDPMTTYSLKKQYGVSDDASLRAAVVADRDKAMQQLGSVGSGAAPSAAAPSGASDARWANYLSLHPNVKDTPDNKSKYLKAIGQ